MKYELKKDNNSKKLIMGVSILFCTVILFIGVTTAFFTQSGIGDTGNIVSINQVSLEYFDNDAFMLGELIPIDEDKVEYAYNRENNLKCKDDEGYNVCSIYQFTVTNTSNVVQDIIIDLYPKENGFHNLEFNLYDVTKTTPILENVELEYDNKEPINLKNDIKLDTTNNKSVTYELVFYIENDLYNDQSQLDAGKNFSANIRVDSVTTGYYLVESVGDEKKDCWIFDEEDTTKVNTFNGFDENDNVKSYCEDYFKKIGDYYTIEIPTQYAGQPIKTLGYNLFSAIELAENGFDVKKINDVNKIIINNGIEIIEEGQEDPLSEVWLGTFSGIGFDYSNMSGVNHDRTLEVEFPDSLKEIGKYAFVGTALREVTISPNVEKIGESAFYYTSNLITLTFENSIDNPSKLKFIGNFAFSNSSITTDSNNPLIIPYSVQMIGNYAFSANSNLTKLTFDGDLYNYYEDEDNYNLLSIGRYVFHNTGLNYSEVGEELILPARINSIGENSFGGDSGNTLNDTLKNIRYMGSRDRLDELNKVYWTQVTVKALGE